MTSRSVDLAMIASATAFVAVSVANAVPAIRGTRVAYLSRTAAELAKWRARRAVAFVLIAGAAAVATAWIVLDDPAHRFFRWFVPAMAALSVLDLVARVSVKRALEKNGDPTWHGSRSAASLETDADATSSGGAIPTDASGIAQ